MAISSNRMFRGPANTFPPLRCERLEERSVLSLVPSGLLLLHGANIVETTLCDSEPAVGILVEEGTAEVVATDDAITADDGDIVIDGWEDSGDDSWYTDSWSSDEETWDDSWVSDDESWDASGYSDDGTWDDSWVPDDEYWDDSWTTDDTWSDWLPDDGGDVAILPTPGDGTWVRDWNTWGWAGVPGSDNGLDSGGIYFAMGAAGGIPVDDPLAPRAPFAPDTTSLAAPMMDTGSFPAAALITPVAETNAPAAIAIALPPDASAKKLNALPDVTMPSSGSDTVTASAVSGVKSEPAYQSATLAVAAPTEPSNDHLADPASLALTDDLPVG